MDKRYIKLGDELVEVAFMDTSRKIFAPITHPSFKESAEVDFTDESNNKSIVNIEHLEEKISDLKSDLESKIDNITSVDLNEINLKINSISQDLTKVWEAIDLINTRLETLILSEGLKNGK